MMVLGAGRGGLPVVTSGANPAVGAGVYIYELQFTLTLA